MDELNFEFIDKTGNLDHSKNDSRRETRASVHTA